MFSHIMVGANDLTTSRKFYDAVLGTLGVKAGVDDPHSPRIFWMSPEGLFVVTKPIDGKEATHANGGTIGFGMRGPEQADAWHKAGIENGGTSCEDSPGWREGPAGRMYLAYLRDPDGNKLCAVHRES